MNLTSARNLLYKFFLENERLILPDNLLKVVTITEYPEFDTETLKLALKSFEEVGIVKSFEFKDGKNNKLGYILERPIQSFEQDIKVGGDLAGIISNTINSVGASIHGVKEIESNPLSLTQTDLESLIIIISTLLADRQDNSTNLKTTEED